jgi:hypothetical protein
VRGAEGLGKTNFYKQPKEIGIDIFLYQTIHEVSTRQLCNGPSSWNSGETQRGEIKEGAATQVEDKTLICEVMNRKLPHFDYKTRLSSLFEVDQRGRRL